MQKDTIITDISSSNIVDSKTNNKININDIDKTILYKNGKEIITIKDGYLDIGLNDTMGDLIVNFIGALVFCSFGYFYIKTNNKKSFVTNFVPQKCKREIPELVKKKMIRNKKSR